MDEPPPEDLEPFHLGCTVWEPTRLLRVYGLTTCDLWIRAGRITIRPKSNRLVRLYDFKQIEYTWPTVVLQRGVLSFGDEALLIDIEGRLGAAWVERRRSLAANLDAYGFNVIRSPRRSWQRGAPVPVPREVLGSHVNEVPPSLLAPI